MLSASEFANFILSFESMSHKRLQKLCYYVYSWHLVIYNEKISNINFEAWVHGPVSREIYNEYKIYGWHNIPQYKGYLEVNHKMLDLANKVFEYYSSYTADQLENLTHHESPWLKAREGYDKYDSSSEIIKNEDIINFYRDNEFYNELINKVN